MVNRSDPEERIAVLREAIESAPDDPSNYYMLGREYLLLAQFIDAVDAFKQCVAVEPDYTAAYRELGLALEKEGHLHDAREAFQKGIKVADRTRDFQTKKEMEVFLKRLDKNA